MSTLEEMKAEVTRVNQEKGWYDAERTFGDLIALLHSEVSEALEAYRETGDSGFFLDGKPEGVPAELADVLIRLLDMCDRYGIDLDYWYHVKINYNKTRPYRHGGKRL